MYVTGNYLFDEANESESDEDSDDDDDYDLPPGMEDLIGDESEDDELDNIDGAGRIEEVDTDEDAPQLVPSKKGNNKRSATDEPEGLDELIAKDEPKLSKKQAKKLKNNDGKAVAAEKDTPKSEKKVQFAKNLEQGPTPTASPAADKAKLGDKSKKPAVRTEKGVQIDDRKVGTGRTAKPGDRVGMRYIGKLENGKVFDCKLLVGESRKLDANKFPQRTRKDLHSHLSWERVRSLKAGTLVSRAWPSVESAA